MGPGLKHAYIRTYIIPPCCTCPLQATLRGGGVMIGSDDDEEAPEPGKKW